MKNLSLKMQIWLVLAGVTLGFTIVSSILFPVILRDFFTTETYDTIDRSQELLENLYQTELDDEFIDQEFFNSMRSELDGEGSVNHMLMSEDGDLITSTDLPRDFIDEVEGKVKNHQGLTAEHTGAVNGGDVFYQVRASELDNEKVYLISYMWDTYRDDLVQPLFHRLLLMMITILMISWIPSLLLAKYLSKPLLGLEERVKKLTNRQWEEPITVERKDEIGRLGGSIEQLRQQLNYNDEMQQSFLQYISHELKTPVMVIRSYTQSLQDGIYPKGNFTDTVQVIDDEAEQLEKRIQNLLYLTKLDYMESYPPDFNEFDLAQLIREVYDRLRFVRQELDWSMKLPETRFIGDREQWKVVLENILDNQIRYAKNEISVNLYKDNEVMLHIWNDGPPIDEEQLTKIFAKFEKDYKGKHGLGLTVVQKIVSLHQGDIWLKNENDGVSFYILV